MTAASSNILLVVSDETRHNALTRTLSNKSMALVTAPSAARCMEMVNDNNPPDLIIVDLHLGDLAGWQLCRVLRSEEFPETNATPILLLSHIFEATDLKSIARRLGANAVCALPYDPADLRTLTTRLLKDVPPITPPQALLVEDDPAVRKLITSGLKRQGYEVVTADSVGACRTLLDSVMPDVAIVDHMLGSANGHELLPLLQKLETPPIIIVITAVLDPALAIDYTHAGANAFIRKPFTVSYLTELIHKSDYERSLQRVEHIMEARTRSLYQAELMFHDLYNNAPVGYHTLNPDGVILSMNQTELDWLGYTPEELVNTHTIFDLQTPPSARKGRSMFENLKTTGRLGDVELEFIRKDGSIMPVIIQSVLNRDPEGNMTYSRTIVRDISDQRQLEEQLRHAQKMESLGVMSIGIAHNFNNLLTPILVNASDLLAEFSPDSEQHEILEDIVDTTRRASKLVAQLTALGRSGDPSMRHVNLSKLTRQTVNVLRKTLESSTQVNVQLTEKRAEITGNPELIEQVLLNLSFNARDAMPEGGTITLELETAEITEETISMSALADIGHYYVLSVSDTGVGISRDIQERIFDPFFTTKGLANGTGLGLTTAYGIMRDHGGFIHLYSEPGHGSLFRLYFPIPMNTPSEDASPGESVTVDAPDTDNGNVSGGKECILIIDDENEVRRSASRILQKSGYSVLNAENGMRGLHIIRQALDGDVGPNGEQIVIDLVILDVVMPGMSGENVLEHLRKLSTNLPVLVASGYGNAERVLRFMDRGAQGTIAKPFDTRSLLRHVRNILDEATKPL